MSRFKQVDIQTPQISSFHKVSSKYRTASHALTITIWLQSYMHFLDNIVIQFSDCSYELRPSQANLQSNKTAYVWITSILLLFYWKG